MGPEQPGTSWTWSATAARCPPPESLAARKPAGALLVSEAASSPQDVRAACAPGRTPCWWARPSGGAGDPEAAYRALCRRGEVGPWALG